MLRNSAKILIDKAGRNVSKIMNFVDHEKAIKLARLCNLVQSKAKIKKIGGYGQIARISQKKKYESQSGARRVVNMMGKMMASNLHKLKENQKISKMAILKNMANLCEQNYQKQMRRFLTKGRALVPRKVEYKHFSNFLNEFFRRKNIGDLSWAENRLKRKYLRRKKAEKMMALSLVGVERKADRMKRQAFGTILKNIDHEKFLQRRAKRLGNLLHRKFLLKDKQRFMDRLVDHENHRRDKDDAMAYFVNRLVNSARSKTAAAMLKLGINNLGDKGVFRKSQDPKNYLKFNKKILDHFHSIGSKTPNKVSNLLKLSKNLHQTEQQTNKKIGHVLLAIALRKLTNKKLNSTMEAIRIHKRYLSWKLYNSANHKWKLQYALNRNKEFSQQSANIAIGTTLIQRWLRRESRNNLYESFRLIQLRGIRNAKYSKFQVGLLKVIILIALKNRGLKGGALSLLKVRFGGRYMDFDRRMLVMEAGGISLFRRVNLGYSREKRIRRRMLRRGDEFLMSKKKKKVE